MNLKRYVLLVHFADVLILLFGAVSIALFTIPGTEYHGSLFWLVFGILFIFLGLFFSIVAHRHLRRCMWIYRNMNPIPMILNFRIEESSDSTDYFALLESQSSREKWQIALLPIAIKKRVAAKKNIPSRVYFDPVTQSPLVVETHEGILWGMAGNGAVKRVG
jgi:hypothetical protein